jgi:ferritin-like metal-binding protein YciE
MPTSTTGTTPPSADISEARQPAARQLLVVGLRDAHALEEQALTVHRQQVDRLDDFPAFKSRLQAHIAETEGQVARIEAALERLGEGPSSLKDAGMKFAGWAQSAGKMMADDRVIKAAIAVYGVKGFELASYRALERLAAMVGDTTTGADMQASHAEEKAMVDWLESEIGDLTAAYVEQAERA